MWYFDSSFLWVRLVRGNGEWEMESHSVSLSFLCLDKFYKDRNGIKSNFDGNKFLLLSKILIHHTYLVFGFPPLKR